MSGPNYEIKLTLAESGLVLQALAECPFKKVFELIGKLNIQAQQFYQPNFQHNKLVSFNFLPSELGYCVKALGELPYTQVHKLMENLHQQISEHPATQGLSHDDV